MQKEPGSDFSGILCVPRQKKPLQFAQQSINR